MSQRVSSWTIELRKAVAYDATLVFRNDGVLFDFDSAEIIIEPSTGGLLSWTEGNGKFTHTSTGIWPLKSTAEPFTRTMPCSVTRSPSSTKLGSWV